MKKFLSLVLALVMTMSLVTISAGAKDFTDNSKIDYKEAVDVVSALKIVDGYTDGSFNPSATLTRGAAAKIICNLILGPTTASALVADSAPYVDVPTSNNFAGYIAYCAQQGIISGYADGTFRPAGTLTGYAFMKMLLGALGYDAKIEGFVGPNWSVQVAKTAIGAGLNKGNEDFNGVQPVTREQAALYAFNTLKADMVEYDNKGSSITVGGVEIITNPSKAEPIRIGDTGKLDDVKFSTSDALQFGEKFFKNLTVEVNAADNFGRPANQWKLKGTEIGKYAKAAALTYTDEVSGDNIYDDLAKPFVESTGYFDNSATSSAVPSGFDVKNNNKVKLGGHAKTVSVYTADHDDDDKLEITITVVENFGGKVQSVTEARGSNKRYVTLDNGYTFETEEFDEDDVVVYTMSDPTVPADAKIRTMALAEKLADQKIDKINRTKSSFTAGGETYDFSANVDNNSPDELTAGNTYDVYTDANGFVVYIEETEASVNQYAVVIDSSAAIWATGNGRLRLLLSDGKKVEVEAEITNGSVVLGELVTYTVDDDGVYDIDADPHVETVTQVLNDVSKLASGAYADSKTVYFVLTTKNGTSEIASGNELDSFEIYTGVKNIPDVDLDGATRKQAVVEGSTAKAVVLTNTSLSNSDMTYVISKGFNKFTERNTEYYAFNAVIDGEITTLEIKASEVDSKLNTNADDALDSAVFAIKNSNVNNNGRATSITLASIGSDVYDGTVTTGYKRDVVYVDGVYYTIDKDADIFVVADNGEIVSATGASLSRGQKVMFTLDSTDERIVSAVVYTDIAGAAWH